MLFSSISCHDWALKWPNELIKVHKQRCQSVTERCSSTLESGSATLKAQVRYFPKLKNSGNFHNFTTLQSCESCPKLKWTFSWWTLFPHTSPTSLGLTSSHLPHPHQNLPSHPLHFCKTCSMLLTFSGRPNLYRGIWWLLVWASVDLLNEKLKARNRCTEETEKRRWGRWKDDWSWWSLV